MLADLLDVARRQAPAASIMRPGFQPLPISAYVPWRYVVTFRGDPRVWAPLVAAPLRLDLAFGEALVSACILSLEGVGTPFMPRLLRFDTLEILYRIAVILPDGRRSFTTLRSDVSSRRMSVLGQRFSHYLPHRAAFDLDRSAGVDLSCRDDEGQVSRFRAPDTGTLTYPATSVFGTLEASVDAILGVDGSVSVRGDRLCFQRIAHPPWNASFVTPELVQLPFLDAAAAHGGSQLVYDSTLLIKEQRQMWTPMRTLPKPDMPPSPRTSRQAGHPS